MARHLRSTAPSGDSADAAAGSAARRASCPDAETLAAYHERSLLPEEMNSSKEHIVSCAHCQELLAHLELTDKIPLSVNEKEEVLSKMDGRHAVTEEEFATLPRPAVAREGPRAARLSGGVRWRWLAPASAIAAGLLVWIGLHENHPPRFPSPNELKVEKNQEPASPPPVLTPALSAPPAARSSPANSRAAADQLSSPTVRAEYGKLEDRQVAGLRAKGALAESSADKESPGRKDAGRDATASVNAQVKQLNLDDKTVGGALQKKSEIQAQSRSQEQNAPLQNQNNAYSPKVSGPGPMGQAEASKKMKAAAPMPSAPLAGASGNLVGSVSELVMVSDSRLISVPGSNFVWRTGPAGLIEFSQNGGRSWVRQTSGVLVDLLTGSAPSDQVCWIVGRVGAILLTTDGGEHWKLIPSPLKNDLARVQATDALHATIWNTRNSKSYVTTDGGLTWNRVGKL
jgi:hypothetical protein